MGNFPKAKNLANVMELNEYKVKEKERERESIFYSSLGWGETESTR
jgi:hypothetical protein